jgi:hypothetical protein
MHEKIPLALLLAINHQNILGWDLFMKGYTSTYWSHLCNDLMQNSETHFSSNWDVKFVDAAISLYKGIWEAWNKHMHGSTREESSMLQRKKIQDQVIRLCHYPPRLASRNSSIKRIPLEDRLKKSTTHLKHWISRIKHQVNVSDLLHMKDRERQCCI